MPTDNETMLMLGRLEGKLDALISQVGTVNNRLEAHEGRISDLERWRAYLVGIGAAVGVIVTHAVQYLRG